MDFARPLVCEESVITCSKIRHINPVPSEERQHQDQQQPIISSICTNEGGAVEQVDDKELDRQVIQAANRAASQLFFGLAEDDNDDETTKKVDCTKYPERLLPRHPVIQSGDLVVIQEAFDKLDFVYATPGKVFCNRNGQFPHDDFIGQPYGCKIRSRDNRGYGFLYLLKPTPELWVRSLNHRTQIVHELDSAQIVYQLHLRPNMIVAESGTGSTAMSHSIVRTIAPHGHLHTYEFNQSRAEAARAEFAKNGISSNLVTVHHGDACQEGFAGLKAKSVHAVFLDLPEPWRAVPHAAFVLKYGSRIATYSPCVEQTQRTVAALEQEGFHSLSTMEYRLQEHYVDEVEYEPPPTAKRVKVKHHLQKDSIITSICKDRKLPIKDGKDGSALDDEEEEEEDDDDNDDDDQTGDDTAPPAAKRAKGIQDSNVSSKSRRITKDRMVIEESDRGSLDGNDDENVDNDIDDMDQIGEEEVDESLEQRKEGQVALGGAADDEKNGNAGGGGPANNDRAAAFVASTAAAAVDNNNKKKMKVVVARPFNMMRGHTAYLTFATLGPKKRNGGGGGAS